MSNEIVQIADEIKAHWLEYEELVDPNCEFGAQVAAILADRDDDKLGRIHDLQQSYAERCARYAIECDVWHGQWGYLKNRAGHPNYYSFRMAA